jgi:hypothetical protein
MSCPLGVNLSIFGVGRDQWPAIAGEIVGSALCALSAVENWSSTFAEKLTFVAPFVGETLVTRSSGRRLSATACEPVPLGAAGADDAGVCAFAWCVATTTPPAARMTTMTATTTMDFL